MLERRLGLLPTRVPIPQLSGSDSEESVALRPDADPNLEEIKEGFDGLAAAITHHPARFPGQVREASIFGHASSGAPSRAAKYRFFYNGEEVRDKHSAILDSYLRAEETEGSFQFQIVPCDGETADSWEERRGLSAGEQEALWFSREIPTITGSEEKTNSDAYLRLMKFAYLKLRRGLGHHVQTEDGDTDFVNVRIEQLARKELADKLRYTPIEVRKFVKMICRHFPFVLTQATRISYFRLTGIRRKFAGMYSMEEMLEAERKNRNRLKIKVSRETVVEDGMRAMERHPETTAALEFDFADEKGSGTGPTLEFYSLSASALRERAHLWRTDESCYTCFPAPLDPRPSSVLNDTCNLFRYMGWLIARAIVDERLLDLPLAEPFWDLVLGRSLTLNDVQRVDRIAGELLLELDGYVRERRMINGQVGVSAEEKARLVSQLVLSVYF